MTIVHLHKCLFDRIIFQTISIKHLIDVCIAIIFSILVMLLLFWQNRWCKVSFCLKFWVRTLLHITQKIITLHLNFVLHINKNA